MGTWRPRQQVPGLWRVMANSLADDSLTPASPRPDGPRRSSAARRLGPTKIRRPPRQ
ncbi:uncharacterized protein LY79DRAFT_541043 [Colletotrichum navitas]|uniref:Uncharacterized protein n=1 Tax=Colletotrichum navitas TaxID=681940 RepID=A0AAD8V829_9PEZI|nr:uncharacterized protein LY79DRAFT_541043 [Colletotrichum navitas]KAK1597767.1 hypothetical protein LY79DRAFT_541043 [Colletotrichum navitas]